MAKSKGNTSNKEEKKIHLVTWINIGAVLISLGALLFNVNTVFDTQRIEIESRKPYLSVNWNYVNINNSLKPLQYLELSTTNTGINAAKNLIFKMTIFSLNDPNKDFYFTCNISDDVISRYENISDETRPRENYYDVIPYIKPNNIIVVSLDYYDPINKKYYTQNIFKKIQPAELVSEKDSISKILFISLEPKEKLKAIEFIKTHQQDFSDKVKKIGLNTKVAYWNFDKEQIKYFESIVSR